jgi:hypothetical protein
MSDIFISYAHEDRALVKLLAEALVARGWSVWWDRAIPAGKIYSQVIAEALANTQCVIVVWSTQSVNSNWVREEAEEGRNRGILIPVLMEQVNPPIGFRSIQAADLVDWDGTGTSLPFQQSIADVAAVIGSAPNTRNNPEQPAQKVETSQPKSLKQPKKKSRQWLVIGISAGTVAVSVTIFLVLGIFQAHEQPSPLDTPTLPRLARVPISQTVSATIYSHEQGFTMGDAEKAKRILEENGISSRIEKHIDPASPDAIFIGTFVSANEARIAISAVPYEIKYIFRPDYSEAEGGSPSGYLIGIGYMSTHNKEFRSQQSEPIKISAKDLKYLTELGLSNAEFQRRLRQITRF